MLFTIIYLLLAFAVFTYFYLWSDGTLAEWAEDSRRNREEKSRRSLLKRHVLSSGGTFGDESSFR